MYAFSFILNSYIYLIKSSYSKERRLIIEVDNVSCLVCVYTFPGIHCKSAFQLIKYVYLYLYCAFYRHLNELLSITILNVVLLLLQMHAIKAHVKPYTFQNKVKKNVNNQDVFKQTKTIRRMLYACEKKKQLTSNRNKLILFYLEFYATFTHT